MSKLIYKYKLEIHVGKTFPTIGVGRTFGTADGEINKHVTDSEKSDGLTGFMQ